MLKTFITVAALAILAPLAEAATQNFHHSYQQNRSYPGMSRRIALVERAVDGE